MTTIPAPSVELATSSSMLDDWIGRNVFVRTVTMHLTGRVVAVDGVFIHLADAAWIADAGRWSAALSSGTLNEVEPFPGDVLVGVGSIVDLCEWSHDLPRTVK